MVDISASLCAADFDLVTIRWVFATNGGVEPCMEVSLGVVKAIQGAQLLAALEAQ